MTGERKQAGQGDFQKTYQVRRRSARKNEYRFFIQHAKSDSLARTYANPVKVLLPSKTFKRLYYQVTFTSPRSSACYYRICTCRQCFQRARQGVEIIACNRHEGLHPVPFTPCIDGHDIAGVQLALAKRLSRYNNLITGTYDGHGRFFEDRDRAVSGSSNKTDNSRRDLLALLMMQVPDSTSLPRV